MENLILSVTLVVVLVLGAAALAMAGLGLVGILTGRRLLVDCPDCGRWRLDLSEKSGSRVCAHCAHPERFRWQPTLVHMHPPRSHR